MRDQLMFNFYGEKAMLIDVELLTSSERTHANTINSTSTLATDQFSLFNIRR